MKPTAARCLVLACGNTLRGDDGVGPWLAAWAEERFAASPDVLAIYRQQWTPDLAEDIARVDSVLFLDCSIESAPGQVNIKSVAPAVPASGLATHHVGAPELLTLARDLYGSTPRSALLLTVGAGSTDLGESFSPDVTAALPYACSLIDEAIRGSIARA